MRDHLVTTPFIETPAGATCGLIETSDRVKIRVARWLQTTGVDRGTVCVMQGRSECIEKYFEVIADLLARGFAVVSFDWRGQGGSQRLLSNARKGHVDDFELFERDLSAVFADVLQPDCPKPWFALAHSMGGCALLLALDRGETRFERVVLSSPMIRLAGLRMPAGAVLLAQTLDFLGLGGSFIPGGSADCLSTKPFDGNRLSGDRQRYDRNAAIMKAAPDLALGDATIGWVNAAFRAMARISDPDFGSRITTPSLMLHGSADRLCSPEAVAELALRIRCSRAIGFQGARHELLMETDAIRAGVYAAFDAFVPGEVVGSGADQRHLSQAPRSTSSAAA